MYAEFCQTAKEIFLAAQREGRLIRNPDTEQLRSLSLEEPGIVRTRYDSLEANGNIQCYLLNTGWVGEGEHFHDITLGDTMGILDALLRGTLEHWTTSEGTGLTVPSSVPGVDSILMHPIKLYGYAEFARRQKALDRQRAEFLDQYPGLNQAIRAVFQK